MGKYWNKALMLLQNEYEVCPNCGTPTTDALLCASCDHMHCLACEARMTRIPSKIAHKARKEQDKEATERYMIASVVPERKKPTIKGHTDDPYLQILRMLYRDIVQAYVTHADQKPVILYDVQDHMIYVCSFVDYLADLAEHSRLRIAQQYSGTLGKNQLLVSIRDTFNDVLISYTIDINDGKEGG